ncbi:response regulator transcription factor [Paludisphaera mucosa]|uniref:Response regulator n=1 Tax=Paludisphaera mucosa TaxID=3030827 RepID=A0ABT6F7X4_9BACT|nr:response regulator [Paludisphaera mucosa]MDG3003683.1 response regulator [Paludisphaera mucosa]
MSMDPLGRLLLVEDENVLRGLVHQFLTLENYDVEPVADGQAAVDAYACGGPYDVILLDLNLPVLPGVEACRQIKLMNPRQPFLVCSAAVLESHIEALHTLGVFDTLGKPYHPSELLTRIRMIMARVQAGAAITDSVRRGWRPDGRAHATLRPSALSEARMLE